jgi:hypothetical protein
VATIVLAGALAQKPQLGGHAWVFLQYLLGFRRLGYDVLFVDWLPPGTSFDAAGRPAPVERSETLRALRRTLEPFGLGGSFALLHEDGVVGTTRRELLARLRRSRLLLNVMGYLDDEELLAAAPLRVFLDIDPGFGQIWAELGLADLFAGHDAFVTIAENLGRPGCTIPTLGLDWVTTRQPIVLDLWPPTSPNGGAFTSIGVWRGPYAPLEYRGRTLGLRAHEFRKFAALPRLAGRRFEAALAIDPAETRDLELLDANGWTLINPIAATGDAKAYHAFVRGAFAEFMVAKGVYVDTRSGWFSDRSICFLASGKPVLAQDTGLGGLYPLGRGLLAFSTLDEAVEGVERISAEPALHARAARRLAEEEFDSDRVLRRLLARLEVA